ncbi:MAG: insulinase family protein [Acidobacteria bacterium]|nr:insulinase family protein [Acidobacteriota bacterium]
MRKTRNWLLFGVLALAFLLSPRALAADGLDVPFEMFTLKNGLTVIVHEDHSAPIASVNVWYHVGSGRETPGRTGFAHLFEHIMFNGSKNVPEGAYDRWLEAVGGNNNGSTTNDRTNYWINIPSNALETALFVESDRMAYLLDTMSLARVDQQRDVVKNERRQSYENAPYGMAPILLTEAMYPKGHPYSWPVIGYMADLTAASHEDVSNFFKKWYGPSNAVLVIAGDVTTAEARRLTAKWFDEVPATPPVAPLAAQPVQLLSEKRLLLEDDVELPRLYLSWPAPPAMSASATALEVLSGLLGDGKNSRLHKKLVHELQIAQSVETGVDAGALASTFDVVVTAREGQSLEKIRAIVDEEIRAVATTAPPAREVARVKNQLESRYLSQLERIGGFGGKADLLNEYLFRTGNPGYFSQHLALLGAVSGRDLATLAATTLGPGRVLLSVVPKGKKNLAVPEVSK